MTIAPMTNNMIQHQVNFAMSNAGTIERINWDALSADDAAMLHAAKEFEAYFLQMMFRAMRATVNQEGGILPPNNMEMMFRDMLDEQVARDAVSSGRGIGLAQQIFRQMSAQRNEAQIALMHDGVYGGANVRVDDFED